MSQRYHQFPTISYKSMHTNLYLRIFSSSVSQIITCQQLESRRWKTKKLDDCNYIGFIKMNIGLTNHPENG